MRLTLIERAELYTPEPAGVASILLAGHRILKVGRVDARQLAALDLPVETVDAGGCVVVPGLVDPHANVIGAGGEQGWASRQPELTLGQLLRAGITTVVGILGADATTRHLTAVLGKVREFTAKGLTGYMYTGAMQTPPPTITGSIVDDLVLIPEVIGLGELAISDVRSTEPSLPDLARWVSQALLGGNTGGKAGVTRFHVGPSHRRLAPLHALLDEYDIPPERLHPTHVTRSRELLDDAIALARRGAYVDTDTVEDDTAKWLPIYLANGGPPNRFMFSSDAQTPGGTPAKLYQALVACVREQGLGLERALRFFTSNAAAALALPHKGRIVVGADGDLLLLRKGTLEIHTVIARGSVLLQDGRMRTADPGVST
jgi:beta-aspartyl-dipeptidase (metallo-type)